jgi:hypothetical protein
MRTLPLLLALLLPATARCAGPHAAMLDWAIAAKAHGLKDDDIARLARNRFIVGPTSAKQVFSFYIGGRLPRFITSDSILNAYHVLFEETVFRLEAAQAARLPGLLRDLWAGLKKVGLRLDGKPELAASARRRARLVIGIALELLGETAARDDKALAPLIQEEARRVIAGKGTGKPKWLGPPDAGFMALDYSRHTPRGFYTRTEKLKKHFRAVAWLQSIPFRAGKDEELLSALVLGAAVKGNEGLSDRVWDFCHAYRKLLGTGDDWDLVEMWYAVPSKAARTEHDGPRIDLKGDGLGKIRDALVKDAAKGRPAINDQIAFIPDDPRQAAEVGFRVLSAHRLPDAVLFARTTDPRNFDRAFPDGLEVCALLGSSFAKKRLPTKVARAAQDGQPLFAGKSLYNDYLRCLSTLFDPPEKDAPALFHSEAWAAKSCQTALAGWAQMRHTWALQAKMNERYYSQTRDPMGFVEPVPELYARLGDLARRIERLFDERASREATLRSVAEQLRVYSKFRNNDEKKPSSKEEALSYYSAWTFLSDLDDILPADLDKLADQLERGELPADENLRKSLLRVGTDVKSRWSRLARICDRLEMLSHKQLRQADFNARDRNFLEGYGKELAYLMFYESNSYVRPIDDAPRVIDVFSNPTRRAAYLEVGIGRPRELLILYPWKGRDRLCVGGVLPYHEFTHGERLDDAGWKRLLHSKDAPRPPAWLRPILAGPGR